jgi:integrase
VELPKEIIEALGDGQPDDYVIDLNPGTISDRFRALKKRLDISIRFHDLRGYCASIMAALGIADTYAQRRGGWSSSGVLKSIYQNVITEHEKQFSAQLNEHFSSLLKKYD